MAVIISNTFVYSPTLSPPFRTLKFHNQCTNLSHNESRRYIRLFTFTCKVNENDYDSDLTAEESRWRREEQRWLREEQRWLREESRWNSEKNSLLLQIQHLESQLDRFRSRNDYDVDFVVKFAAVLKGLLRNDSDSIDTKRITDFIDKEVQFEAPVNSPEGETIDKEKEKTSSSSSSSSSFVIRDEGDKVRILQEKNKEETEEEKKKTKVKITSSLRIGAEGEEVRILQEALMNLGFYSGEEDMEFSSFSDGTSSAVKTWQASIGVREDGIMTAELLERLYGSQEFQSSESSLKVDIQKIDEANGAVTEVRRVQQTVAKKTDVDASHHRVFLLGENRWEEPSRLNRTKGNVENSARKCPTCKGEGRLLCMECDGTGEPNVEEQFLDWVEQEAKCPYCDGLGYNVCDICNGKQVI